MFSPWPAPPSPLRLEPGWAHIFRLRLDLDPARLAVLGRLLNAEEQARAARYIPENARRHFIAARGQLRTVLGAYLGQPPEGLCFTLNAQGKPALPGSRLCFNLSHSAGLGLLVVTAGQEVGVDLESTRRPVEIENIARRFFAPQETAALLALPAEEQPRAFFTIWTRKEAYIKARGLGLSIPLDSFTVSAGLPATLTAPDPGWTIHDIPTGPDYAAALVAQGELQGLHLWDWQQSPSRILHD